MPIFNPPGLQIRSEAFDWDANLTPAPSTVNVGDMIAFELPNSLTRSVVGMIQVPASADLSAINPVIRVAFAPTSSGSGNANIRMQLNVKYIGAGELATKANDETLLQTEAVIDTIDEMQFMTFDLDVSLITAGDQISIKMDRLGGDAADTFTGDVGILEVGRLQFLG